MLRAIRISLLLSILAAVTAMLLQAGELPQAAPPQKPAAPAAAEDCGCDEAVAVDRHIYNWMTNKSRRMAWVQKIKMWKTDALGRPHAYMYTGQVVFRPYSEFAKFVEDRKKGKLGDSPGEVILE